MSINNSALAAFLVIFLWNSDQIYAPIPNKKFVKSKMAKVHVCNVLVLDNPAQFMSKLEFEITFECIEDLPEDLEWKIIYVGSAESEEYDQILDTVYVWDHHIFSRIL